MSAVVRRWRRAMAALAVLLGKHRATSWLTPSHLVTGLLALLIGVIVGTGAIGRLLSLTPGGVRELPGVRVLVPVSPPEYTGSVFGLRAPLSVSSTPDGREIYVAEGDGDRVVKRIATVDGSVIAELVPPLTEAGTRKPISVAVTRDGTVYVVDRIRRTVDIFDAQNQWLGVLPSPSPDFEWAPLSVDVDEDGRAYVTNSDERSPVLTVYDASGAIERAYDTILAAGVPVSFPNSVGLDRAGRLVIGDSNNARLVVLDPVSGETRVYGTLPTETLALPRGVALDQHGYMLVVDANDHSVSAWDFDRTPLSRVFIVGEAGIGDGAFLFPNDISIDEDGRIYIADRENDRVQVWRY